jgi:hypothetical protein
MHKKSRLPKKGSGRSRVNCLRLFCAAFSAAAGTAGTLLFHAGQHKTLPLCKIDDRAVKHLVRPVLQEDLQAVLLESYVARLGDFGYVHSQRGASATWDEEYPHPIACGTLLGDHFLELRYRTVSNTYHQLLPP